MAEIDELRVRRLLARDAGAVDGLVAALPEWFTARARAQVAAALARPRGFLALADGAPAGFALFEPHATTPALELTWLGVRPDLFRHGIGRHLVLACVEEANRRGHFALRVDTLGDSVDYEPYAETRRFYAGLGFVECGRVLQPEDQEWPDRLSLVLRWEPADAGLPPLPGIP